MNRGMRLVLICDATINYTVRLDGRARSTPMRHMHRTRFFWPFVSSLVTGFLGVSGCYPEPQIVAHEGSGDDGVQCMDGVSGCPCFPNRTCSNGLVCTPENTCVPSDCRPGELECPCDAGRCGVGLVCRDGICEQRDIDPTVTSGGASSSSDSDGTTASTDGNGTTGPVGEGSSSRGDGFEESSSSTSGVVEGSSESTGGGIEPSMCDSQGSCSDCVDCIDNTEGAIEACGDPALDCLIDPNCRVVAREYICNSVQQMCDLTCEEADALVGDISSGEPQVLFDCYFALCPASCTGETNVCE